MSGHEEGDALRVAQAVADRLKVDWDREDSGDRRVQQMFRSLRILDEIGAVHDSLHKATERAQDHSGTLLLETTETPSSWGHLRILKRLGQGSFGDVFLAEDSNLKKEVALKLLRAQGWRPSQEDDILQEARKLARVRHANVLTVHGADRIDSRVGIWTEYIDGDTLEQLLKANGPFGSEEATHIGISLCGALAGVHGAGLVHGDIKTANVMREKGGRIVLMDFSSARDRQADDSGGESVVGTPLYMAPEVFHGTLGPAADIYSLGVVLYRLVSMKYPVHGSTVADIKGKHSRGEYQSLRDVCPHLSRAFVKVVERALAPDPGQRYASAGEMEQALAALQGQVVEPSTRPAFWNNRTAWIAGVTMAAALAGAWQFWPRPLKVEAQLFRTGDQVEERLQPGSQVAPGDQLFLEIEGTQEMYVYVFDEDEHGEAVRLYPLESLDLENPLAPGVRHRLPGNVDQIPYYWNVTSRGGSETILAIASRKRVQRIEDTFHELTRAGDVAELPARLDSLRGIAGLSPGSVGTHDDGEPDVMARIREGLDVRAGNGNGLWLWEVRLSNPAP